MIWRVPSSCIILYQFSPAINWWFALTFVHFSSHSALMPLEMKPSRVVPHSSIPTCDIIHRSTRKLDHRLSLSWVHIQHDSNYASNFWRFFKHQSFSQWQDEQSRPGRAPRNHSAAAQHWQLFAERWKRHVFPSVSYSLLLPCEQMLISSTCGSS